MTGWKLKDLDAIRSNGLRVLSTFSGCGGSSMGYKLAGYEVVGGVEIDPKMADNYEHNLKTRVWRMDIRAFIEEVKAGRIDVDVDILDGSPPCSVFSCSGKRSKKWGTQHKFTEGQALQRLDNLFFDFINLAVTLRPKVIVAENVIGLILGKAKGYAKEILAAFKKAGYGVQLFRLDASRMGVPQKRERVFFVASLDKRKVSFSFNERPITAIEAFSDLLPNDDYTPLSKKYAAIWSETRPGGLFSQTLGRSDYLFSCSKASPNKPLRTISATDRGVMCHWSQPRILTSAEMIRGQTFPDDYRFISGVTPRYGCGMSVPPIMMQKIAQQVEQSFFTD